MSFTWIPLYEDLAARLLDYEHRQPELLAFLGTLKEAGLPMVRLVETDDDVPLTEIDPFTFFAVFNRRVTEANRKEILTRMRAFLGGSAAIPEDFEGIPVADNMQSWFFPWAKERQADDVPSLWALARQAVSGGREAVTAATFDRCLGIKSVKIAKLSMGLFWLRPRAFPPLDGQSQPYLRRHGVKIPGKVSAWDEYLAVVEAAVARLGDDFPSLSRAAYVEPGDERRYWAGGHQFGETSKLDEFMEQHTWYIGWKKDDATRGAKAAWKRFAGVKPGDLFAIKGYGGVDVLKVHAVGLVDEVEAEAGRISWTPVDMSLFHAKKAPKPGGGTWRDTLCEVTEPEARAALFGVGKLPEPDVKKPGVKTPPVKAKREALPRPPHPLNLILHGPPGTGKTWTMRKMREDFTLPHRPAPMWRI